MTKMERATWIHNKQNKQKYDKCEGAMCVLLQRRTPLLQLLIVMNIMLKGYAANDMTLCYLLLTLSALVGHEGSALSNSSRMF